MNTIFIGVIIAVFAISGMLVLIRMVMGPSILDRAVASDVMLTMVLCALGAEAAINQHTRTVPAMLIIASIGVFGSIAVARFVARKERDGGPR